jgi:hypothetical protein
LVPFGIGRLNEIYRDDLDEEDFLKTFVAACQKIGDLAQACFSLTSRKAPATAMRVTFRSILQIVIMASLFLGCAEISHAGIFSDGFVVYVGDRPNPSDFDPYFNQPKIYRQPRYYEYTSKKRKGNKVFKTTKVKDQYGRTVYKKTTSHKKKKK